MHKEREEEKGGLLKFLPWQLDKFVWLRSTATAHSCMFCLLFKIEMLLEPEQRPGGSGGPGRKWPHSLARGTSLLQGEGFAEATAVLVANNTCLLLATWLFSANCIFSLM